jgi:hypothetical protein
MFPGAMTATTGFMLCRSIDLAIALSRGPVEQDCATLLGCAGRRRQYRPEIEMTRRLHQAIHQAMLGKPR